MGFERIDDLLNGVTADGSLHGVAATVVSRDGVLYQGAAGDAKPDTMFRNASMTKAVATTAALQLVEQGRRLLLSPDPGLFLVRGQARLDDAIPVVHEGRGLFSI